MKRPFSKIINSEKLNEQHYGFISKKSFQTFFAPGVLRGFSAIWKVQRQKNTSEETLKQNTMVREHSGFPHHNQSKRIGFGPGCSFHIISTSFSGLNSQFAPCFIFHQEQLCQVMLRIRDWRSPPLSLPVPPSQALCIAVHRAAYAI